jgi:hypothetical protein
MVDLLGRRDGVSGRDGDSGVGPISCFYPRHCARSYHFVIAVWRAKAAESRRVKYWE